MCAAPSGPEPRLFAIRAFRLTTIEPERLARFYGGLGFTIGGPEPIPADEMALLGLAGGGVRWPMRLREQRLDLDRFELPGAPYPPDVTGADTRFQHCALVTDDAQEAWERARALGATPISTDGPVTLPASSGGVTAVKFRDPEGHPLEFLQSPPRAKTAWRGAGLLGIDHSAISVADAGASRRFYEALGLRLKDKTFNHGPEQAALDGLPGAEVEVLPMVPERDTPHLELLAYRAPLPRRAPPPAPNDIAATRIVWAADRSAIIRDADGHLHVLKDAQN